MAYKYSGMLRSLKMKSDFFQIFKKPFSKISKLNGVSVNFTPQKLELKFDDGAAARTLNYKPMWLRFNCRDKKSFHEFTAQRIMDLSKIPATITIKNVTRKDSDLYVEWNEDDHISLLPIKYLLDNYPAPIEKPEKKFLLAKHLEKFNYSDLMTDNKKNFPEIKRWVNYIRTYGICVIKNVPIESNNCRKIAEIVAPIQPNLYGDVFEIINTPKPINLALSNEKFMFHMDLPYLFNMPYIQFIQCLRFDKCVVGGESIYLNAVHAAEQFREKYPEEFAVLCEIPATFQRIHYERERPVHMVVKRKHIILNDQNQVEYVTWSPPNEGPLTGVTEEQIDKFYDSYIKFAKFLADHPDQIEYRMEPGDVVCFHNRKMLHSRKAFQNNSGTRHFQGCYIDEDEFKSQSFIFDLNVPTK